MAHTWYRSSAPGTLMLLGEHAVLHNKPALVAAIDKQISVTLIPRQDNIISIHSALGKIELKLDEIKDPQNNSINDHKIKNFRFVLNALKYFQHYTEDFWQKKLTLPSGFTLDIQSEFSSQIGFGSSAAVTVATIAALLAFGDNNIKKININKMSIFQMANFIIQKVQGIGSGADVAAAVFGGIIHYQQHPPYVLKTLSQKFPDLIAVYSGYKTPTIDVIQKVNGEYAKDPVTFDAIFEVIRYCVEKAVVAIEDQDWQQLGMLFNIQQGLMQALGVSTQLLDNLCYSLRTHLLGAKISGAGLGDCIIGMASPGTFKNSLSFLQNTFLQNALLNSLPQATKDNIQIFPIQISSTGLILEQLAANNACPIQPPLNRVKTHA